MTEIELNEEQLAEIELRAIEAETGEWHAHYSDNGSWVESHNYVIVEGSSDECKHIVATQPRVALAMVAEIRRLRTEVEALRDVSRRVLNIGHNNDCLFCGFKDRTASEALHNEKEKQ